MPGNMLDPPDTTMFPYKSLRMSRSQRIIELYVVSCMPADSAPMNDGCSNTSGARNRSLPIVITCAHCNQINVHGLYVIEYTSEVTIT